MRTSGRPTDETNHSPTIENDLVLQGGGSLGAYECGVCNQLYDSGIEFDIIAGASMGAVNASILVSAQNSGLDPAKNLKEFWNILSEPDPLWPTLGLPPPFLLNPGSNNVSDKADAIKAAWHTMVFGNRKAFKPRWFESFFPTTGSNDGATSGENSFGYPSIWSSFFYPLYEWNYLYDKKPLEETLRGFIDKNSLRRSESAGEGSSARLIVTSTDIQKGENVEFDNKEQDISIEMIVACSAYPFYGIRWTKFGSRYLWDGALIKNTPLMQLMRRAPSTDKRVFIVDVFPKRQEKLPHNMQEVWHRARDILFMDKTNSDLDILKNEKEYLPLLRKMNELLQSNKERLDTSAKNALDKLAPEFNRVAGQNGGVIKEVVRVTRSERLHYLLEDMDFSVDRINKLINDGAMDCAKTLESRPEARQSGHVAAQ